MAELDAKSKALLAQCDQGLSAVMHMAAMETPFQWKVVQSARTIEQQRAYYKAGTSRINPDKYATREELYKHAKHIVGPEMPLSRAVDVAIVGKEPYHVPTLSYLAGVVRKCASMAKVKIRWGGDFDQDGMLLEAGSFQDLPHFEVVS